MLRLFKNKIIFMKMIKEIANYELSDFKYRGARALILMQEEMLKQFLELWKTAKSFDISLPQVKDPNYSSYEALLRHVLWNAREYMVWICEKLELPDPAIDHAPDPENIEKEADNYLAHLIAKLRIPLKDIGKQRFLQPEYQSRWGIYYCIDAMLEHAVMHLHRHYFQLQELMG